METEIKEVKHRTELDFLDYLERQIISSGEKVYTNWLRQEISFRKSELNSQQNPPATSNGFLKSASPTDTGSSVSKCLYPVADTQIQDEINKDYEEL